MPHRHLHASVRSAADAWAPRVVDFDIGALVEEVAELYAGQAQARHVELAFEVASDVPAVLHGEAGRLREALTTLLGEAVRHTPQGEVVVRVLLGPPQASGVEVCFEVRDTGLGRARRGAAVARVVAQLGVACDISGQPGHGTTVRFAVPLQASTAKPLPVRERFSLEGLRVLLVDDNVTSLSILERQLKSWRLLPTRCSTAQAAVDAFDRAMARGEPFDLGLLDYHVPDVDGLALASELRKRPEGDRLRIVLLGGRADREELAVRRVPRIEAVAEKPLGAAHLYDVLTQVMGVLIPAARRRSPRGRTRADGPPLRSDVLAQLRDLEPRDPDRALAQLVRVFLSTAESRVQRMRAAAEEADCAAAAFEAHALRGVAGTMGAETLASLAQAVEQTSTDAEPGTLSGAVRALAAEFLRVAAWCALHVPDLDGEDRAKRLLD